MTGEDPTDLLYDMKALDLATDEGAYAAKLDTVKQLRANGFTDAQIERLVPITLKPKDRAPTP